MRISNNTSINFKNNTSPFSCFSTVQDKNIVKSKSHDKTSTDILSYNSSEIINTAIGAFGTVYFPYLLIKKIPQKENWSKFNTNLLKIGIPLSAYILADSLSRIFKGKKLSELFKKEETK